MCVCVTGERAVKMISNLEDQEGRKEVVKMNMSCKMHCLLQCIKNEV